MDWNVEQEADDKAAQKRLLEKGRLPRHIAIIMDGNGRWAKEKGLNRTEGHREGIETVREIVKASSRLGVEYLTLYAFSIENWKRPVAEVGILMRLLEHYLKAELDELHQNNVKILTIGKTNSLPKVVQKLLYKAIETTKENTGLTLTLALSYGGRGDIVRAVQMISLDVRRGKVSPEDITDELFASYLQTASIPDPDYLIRTSGERRLSNFLLWEMAYGEIYITDKFWPDFGKKDLYEAIHDYMARERRFGKTSQQLTSEEDDKSHIKRFLDAFKS